MKLLTYSYTKVSNQLDLVSDSKPFSHTGCRTELHLAHPEQVLKMRHFALSEKSIPISSLNALSMESIVALFTSIVLMVQTNY